MTMLSSTLGPLGPFAVQICRLLYSIVHPPGACLPVWCGGGRIKAPNNCLAATVMPGQAVKFQRRMPQISAWAGPSGPRQEGRKVLFSEPPDASAYLPGWRPPVMGVWGWGDLERQPAARRSSETHPQSLFGSFLVIQKGTRPAGRNSPPKHKKILNPS